MVSTRCHTEPEAAHEESVYPVFPQCLQYRWWRGFAFVGERVSPLRSGRVVSQRRSAVHVCPSPPGSVRG